MSLNRVFPAAAVIAAVSSCYAWAVEPPPAPQGAPNVALPKQVPPAANVGVTTGANTSGMAGGGAGVNVNTPRADVHVGTQPGAQFPGSMGRNEAPLPSGMTDNRTMAGTDRISDNRPDQWRYRFHNNRWWYWTPENRWMTYSDQFGWTYPEAAGGYTTGYAPAAVAPATVAPAPSGYYYAPDTTYYYPGYTYGYYYPGRYYWRGGSWGRGRGRW